MAFYRQFKLAMRVFFDITILRKWSGTPVSEIYNKPWNKYGIEYWHFDPTRRQKLRWN